MEFKVHPGVKIGHIHLTVSDLEKSLAFYRDLLGFEITTYYGDSAVFLSAGGYHHHIGLNTWSGKGAPQPNGEPQVYTILQFFILKGKSLHGFKKTLRKKLSY